MSILVIHGPGLFNYPIFEKKKKTFLQMWEFLQKESKITFILNITVMRKMIEGTTCYVN